MSYKSGFVGMIGLPNSGKSTLLNNILNQKVSIVTHKPQTTRRRVLGIYTEVKLQCIFVDTPGVIEAREGLNRFLVEEYRSALNKSDLLFALLNIDAPHFSHLEKIISLCEESKKKWCAVVNKIDLPYPERILKLENKLKSLDIKYDFISTKRNSREAVRTILSMIKEDLPPSKSPLFAEDIYTTETLRDISSEIIREKCFLYLKHELPYTLAVRIRSFKTKPHIISISADIILGRESHKKIVIGKNGASLRRIGFQARTELEKVLDKKVYLDLHVTVKAEWIKNRPLMQELGYDVRK